MSIQVVFKNLDRSETLVEFIEKHSEKFLKLIDPNSNLTYYIEKLAHGLKVSLQLNEHGKHFQAQVVKSNAYDGIGGALKKMRRQVTESNAFLKNKIHRS